MAFTVFWVCVTLCAIESFVLSCCEGAVLGAILNAVVFFFWELNGFGMLRCCRCLFLVLV